MKTSLTPRPQYHAPYCARRRRRTDYRRSPAPSNLQLTDVSLQPTCGSVRGRDLSGALLGRHGRPFQSRNFRATAPGYTVALECVTDGGCPATDESSDLVLRRAEFVQPDGCFEPWQLLPFGSVQSSLAARTDLNPCAVNSLVDSLLADADRGRQLYDAFAGSDRRTTSSRSNGETSRGTYVQPPYRNRVTKLTRL